MRRCEPCGFFMEEERCPLCGKPSVGVRGRVGKARMESVAALRVAVVEKERRASAARKREMARRRRVIVAALARWRSRQAAVAEPAGESCWDPE